MATEKPSTINIGVLDQRTSVNLPPIPAAQLPETWNLPPRNSYFTGRTELLAKIKDCLSGEAMHLVLTVHGLGGIGKTQLTLEYVWRHYRDYRGVCWFNAESKSRLIVDYIILGQELH